MIDFSMKRKDMMNGARKVSEKVGCLSQRCFYLIEEHEVFKAHSATL